MAILREAKQQDIEGITLLAKKTGFGLTTLVPDKCYIKKIIDDSIDRFNHHCPYGIYFFVLEEDAKIIGTAAIHVKPGQETPFYTYKITQKQTKFPPKNISNVHSTLEIIVDFGLQTELCSLFLLPAYRNNINGHLLSYGRFLYMANHLARFTETVFAEVRGVSDQYGRSPFWEAVGRKFYCMDFSVADKLAGLGQKAFIDALKPEDPIYINLLPEEAKTLIGVPHPQSVGAVKLLERQNFVYDAYVDIFDAGPTLTAKINHIETIKQAKKYRVAKIKAKSDGNLQLISTVKGDFKAAYQPVSLLDDEGVCIGEETAKILKVNINDEILLAPLFY